jgi:hypothetical protein
MRLKLSAVLFGLALSAAIPAMAQTTTQTTNAPYAPYAPVYNTAGNAPVYYSATPNGAIPVYNNTNSTPTLPMQQMIAGKNAPSYQFNQQQPYGAGGTNWYTGSGAMSPQHEAQARAQMQQQQAAANAQQQAYMNSLQQQQNAQNISQNGFPDLSVLNKGPFAGSQQPQVPTRRRVIGKEMNNPLKEPPRLFNPDQ